MGYIYILWIKLCLFLLFVLQPLSQVVPVNFQIISSKLICTFHYGWVSGIIGILWCLRLWWNKPYWIKFCSRSLLFSCLDILSQGPRIHFLDSFTFLVSVIYFWVLVISVFVGGIYVTVTLLGVCSFPLLYVILWCCEDFVFCTCWMNILSSVSMASSWLLSNYEYTDLMFPVVSIPLSTPGTLLLLFVIINMKRLIVLYGGK